MPVQHMFSVPGMSSNNTCRPLSANDIPGRHTTVPSLINYCFFLPALMLPSARCMSMWGQQDERRRLVTPLALMGLCRQAAPGTCCSALLGCSSLSNAAAHIWGVQNCQAGPQWVSPSPEEADGCQPAGRERVFHTAHKISSLPQHKPCNATPKRKPERGFHAEAGSSRNCPRARLIFGLIFVMIFFFPHCGPIWGFVCWKHGQPLASGLQARSPGLHAPRSTSGAVAHLNSAAWFWTPNQIKERLYTKNNKPIESK